MIKRTTAVYHVLMVSILLLAHAVIPHIHFNNEIVITGAENHPTKEDCSYNHHKHDDEEGTDGDFCLLKQVYLARTGDSDSDNENPGFIKPYNDSLSLLFITFNTSENLINIPQTFIAYTNQNTPLYSGLGSGNVNSRGSPLA